MEEMLKKIWKGEFLPYEEITDSFPILCENLLVVDTEIQNFINTLTAEQKNAFEEILCKKAVLDNEFQQRAFISGYKFCLKIHNKEV